MNTHFLIPIIGFFFFNNPMIIQVAHNHHNHRPSSIAWSSTGSEKLIALSYLQLHSTTSVCSPLEVHCAWACPWGQTWLAGAALLIGQHSTAQRFLPLSAAATTDSGGRVVSDNRQRPHRLELARAEEVHVLLLSFPASSVSDWTGVRGVVGGLFPRPSPVFPSPARLSHRLCVLFQVRDPDPGATVMSLVTAELRAWARCARAARGGGSWPSLPEESGWTTAMAGERPALCLRVNFLRRVWGEARRRARERSGIWKLVNSKWRHANSPHVGLRPHVCLSFSPCVQPFDGLSQQIRADALCPWWPRLGCN